MATKNKKQIRYFNPQLFFMFLGPTLIVTSFGVPKAPVEESQSIMESRLTGEPRPAPTPPVTKPNPFAQTPEKLHLRTQRAQKSNLSCVPNTAAAIQLRAIAPQCTVLIEARDTCASQAGSGCSLICTATGTVIPGACEAVQ